MRMIEGKRENKKDLKLSKLGHYFGTVNYYDLGGIFRHIVVTDGVKYIMDNGYSWLVTDVASVIVTNKKIRQYLSWDYFLSIKLKVNLEEKTAIMTIGDGNGNILYTQKYQYTDAEVEELTLFYADGVIMLASEW